MQAFLQKAGYWTTAGYIPWPAKPEPELLEPKPEYTFEQYLATPKFWCIVDTFGGSRKIIIEVIMSGGKWHTRVLHTSDTQLTPEDLNTYIPIAWHNEIIVGGLKYPHSSYSGTSHTAMTQIIVSNIAKKTRLASSKGKWCNPLYFPDHKCVRSIGLDNSDPSAFTIYSLNVETNEEMSIPQRLPTDPKFKVSIDFYTSRFITSDIFCIGYKVTGQNIYEGFTYYHMDFAEKKLNLVGSSTDNDPFPRFSDDKKSYIPSIFITEGIVGRFPHFIHAACPIEDVHKDHYPPPKLLSSGVGVWGFSPYVIHYGDRDPSINPGAELLGHTTFPQSKYGYYCTGNIYRGTLTIEAPPEGKEPLFIEGKSSMFTFRKQPWARRLFGTKADFQQIGGVIQVASEENKLVYVIGSHYYSERI